MPKNFPKNLTVAPLADGSSPRALRASMTLYISFIPSPQPTLSRRAAPDMRSSVSNSLGGSTASASPVSGLMGAPGRGRARKASGLPPKASRPRPRGWRQGHCHARTLSFWRARASRGGRQSLRTSSPGSARASSKTSEMEGSVSIAPRSWPIETSPRACDGADPGSTRRGDWQSSPQFVVQFRELEFVFFALTSPTTSTIWSKAVFPVTVDVFCRNARASP